MDVYSDEPIATKDLDDRVAGVVPLLFGRARLVVARKTVGGGSFEWGYDDLW